MALSLELLGEFAVRDGTGAALSLPTRKTRALLAYLAVHAGQPQRRDRLTALLWSDRADQQARQSLNQALRSIRRLGDEAGVTLLDGDVGHVTLNNDAIESDIVRFRALLADEPAEAIKLYEGPFLDGLSIPDPAFEEWVAATRSELHTAVCDGLRRVADAAAEAGDAVQAIRMAQELVSLDPLHEDAHRRLMRYLYDSGDRIGALRQYQTCADFLKKELQVEPDAATKALFDEIKNEPTPSVGPEAPALAAVAPPIETPPLPDKPSIAVLPFENMSGDPEQEYFADGMTEDIITGLSRFRSLFVISRNSTFAYKEKSPDVREVARDLGVRYVLEGSVRRSGQRIRVTAELIDAETGNHLWAERYDRELEDIFAVQDQVTEAIVAAIAPEIDEVERARAQRKPPRNLDAWDVYQRGIAGYHFSTEDSFRSAIAQFDRVNELDPNFASAFAMAAIARTRYVLHFEPDNRNEYLNQAREKASKAINLDPRDAMCLWVDGRVHSMFGHHEAAISRVREAIALNPNDAMAHQQLGVVLCTAGRTEEAISHIDRAIRLSPRDIFLVGMLTHRAFCLFDLKRYEEALEWMKRARLRPNPRTMTYALYVAVLAKLGRQEEAQAALDELLVHAPEMSCGKYRKNSFGASAAMEHFADALRLAGLPE